MLSLLIMCYLIYFYSMVFEVKYITVQHSSIEKDKYKNKYLKVCLPELYIYPGVYYTTPNYRCC